MKQIVKKMPALLASAWVFALGSANATSYDPCSNSCDPSSWFDDVRISAEFILWRPCFENLDYGILVDDTTAGMTPINGDTLNVSHNWKPGFCVGVGIDKVFCGWNLDFDFARIEGCDSSAAAAVTGNGAIYSTLFHGNANDAYSKAESKHSFTYMKYNILFSRSCCLNDCHQFRPYVGVTGIILDQRIRAKYVDQTPSPDNNFFVDWDSDYVGTGLRFGSGYNYAFNDCLGFFFDGSFAMVYGMVILLKSALLKKMKMALSPSTGTTGMKPASLFPACTSL